MSVPLSRLQVCSFSLSDILCLYFSTPLRPGPRLCNPACSFGVSRPVSVGNTFQQPLASLKRFIQVEPFFCSYSLGNFCIDQFLSTVAIILCIKRHFVFLSLLDILLALQFKTFFSVDITMFSLLYFKFTLVTHIQKIITEVTGLNIYDETQ